MKTTLICPTQISEIECLTEITPAVCLPVLGQSVLSCWLNHLAAKNVSEVSLVAKDRSDTIRELCGLGSRWGLSIEITEEEPEATPGEKILMDHLPGMPGSGLFESYKGWFESLVQWLPRLVSGKRIHLREIQPGVWADRRARIAPSARFTGPCWLGEFVEIGKNAVMGPNAFLEDHAVVGEACEVRDSWLGPETFLGNLTGLQSSLAWGSTLINWKTGSHMVVPDEFLMCSLSKRKIPKAGPAKSAAHQQGQQTIVEGRWNVGIAFAQKNQS